MRACVRVCAAVATAVVVIVSVGVAVVGVAVVGIAASGMGRFLCPEGGGASGGPAAIGVVACTCTAELPEGAFEAT